VSPYVRGNRICVERSDDPPNHANLHEQRLFLEALSKFVDRISVAK
jgi:hypothetical protein